MSENASILQEADTLINGDRQADYVHVSESDDRIARAWAVIMGAPVNANQALLCMAALKLVRECYSHKRDNLVDAAGYIGLAEKLHESKSIQCQSVRL